MSANAAEFYYSPAWIELRARRLIITGSRCEMCGGKPSEGFRLEVHHVKPRRSHPQLELEFTNTQVLCRACHKGLHWWPMRGRLPASNDPRFEVVPRKRQPAPAQMLLFEDSS